ncbi:hypothetical protein D3C80_1094870 [compost metagenome]
MQFNSQACIAREALISKDLGHVRQRPLPRPDFRGANVLAGSFLVMPEDHLLNVIVIVVFKKLLFGRSVNDHGLSLDACWSESVVLFAVASGFIHGVLLAIRGEFPCHRLVEVNAEYAAQANQVHQYVRQFVFYG